jgi:predicted SnoaL-like aldol condensation-catalyzing enzyme
MIRPLVLLVVGVMALAGPATASPEANRAVVEALYTRVFNGKDLSVVPDLVAEDYVQHTPSIEKGRDAFVAAFRGYFAAVPGLTVDVKRISTTDNLVVVHSHWRDSPSERGQAVIDIYRLENGRIAEHWDVVQSIPDGAANDNDVLA